MAVAMAMFTGAAVVTFRQLPDIERIRWLPLLFGALGGVPVMLVLNAIEYRLTGRAAEQDVPFREAFRVTVLSSAANVLPVPGSVIVRVQALAERGLAYRRALSAATSIGGVWISTTLSLAGAGQILVGRVLPGLALLAVGGSGLAVALVWLRRQVGSQQFPALARAVTMLEFGFVVVAAARMYFVLLGLDADIDLSDALALTIAGAAANAAGFFPGGLGLREILAAGISPLVGLPAVTGLSATVIQQLAAFLFLGGAAGFFTFRMRPERDASRIPDAS